MEANADEVLTVKEASTRLKCSIALVYRLFGERELTGFRLGKAGIRLYPDGIEAYKKRHGNASVKDTTHIAFPAKPPQRKKAGPVKLDPAFLRHIKL